MLPFKLIYSNDYYLPIGAHVFPAQKYRMIHQRLLETNTAAAEDFLEPLPAADEDILLVHTEDDVGRLKNGTLSHREVVQMHVPHSSQLFKPFCLSVCRS